MYSSYPFLSHFLHTLFWFGSHTLHKNAFFVNNTKTKPEQKHPFLKKNACFAENRKIPKTIVFTFEK